MNFEKVDLYYDFVDRACMILYDDLHIDYFEALIRVSRDLTLSFDDSKLSEEAIKNIEEVYNAISLENFYNEEIRLALELLIIKAFKHINFSLDLMTPDTINYLIAMIIKIKYGEKAISILDTCLGTGNLINAISNNMHQEIELYGIEKNESLVKLAEAVTNLQNNQIEIFFQDALRRIAYRGDVVVGDLEGYSYDESVDLELYHQGVRYFPFLVLEARLENIVDDGYFIYAIDNDFFSQSGSEKLKNFLLDKATLVGLIVLPSQIVKEGHVGKSILIGKKTVMKNYNMAILRLTSFEKAEAEKLFIQIQDMMEQI
ncbi:MAG: N-6 DNA methylase [Bacilli bacterium]|nr:N-6 DNA methylase [Bacilli bacterium]